MALTDTKKSALEIFKISQTAQILAKNIKSIILVLVLICGVLSPKVEAQVIVSTSTNTTCATSCDGAIDLKVSGGTEPYAYTWASAGSTGYKQITLCLTGPAGATNQTATGTCNPPVAITDAAVNLCAGTYSITVTDAGGVTATTIQTISSGTLNVMQVTTDASTTTCVAGCTGSINVNAVGGNTPYTYAWSGSTVTGDTRNGLCAGTYSVTVTDKAGCDSILIYNIGPTPTISISGTPICTGGATVLTASGGSSYSWSPGGATGSTVSVNPASTTTYTVTATNVGCPTSTASFTLTVNPAVTATTTPTNVTCNGTSTGSSLVTPGGGSSPFTYIWSVGAQTSQTATGLTPGTYIVTVTDSKGCTTTSTAAITEPTAITVTPSAVKPACGGSTGSASVTAAGGTPGYSYLWSNAATGQTISGVAAGGYSITVTDSKGCTKMDIITISNTPQPSIDNLTGTSPLCKGGSNGSAVVVASGGTAPLTYNWSNASITTGATGLTAGIYVITVTDAGGCKGVSTVTITEPTIVAATSTFVNSNCGKPDGSVTVAPTGGTGAYTYIWSGTATGQTTTATGLLAGSYTVTVNDANGCTTTTSATLSTQNPGTASITPTSVKCKGGSDGTAVASIVGGTAGFTYAWAPTGGTGQTASNLGLGIYTVTITDANGCTSTSTASITEPSVVTASSTTTSAVCVAPNGTASVTAGGGTPGYQYLWNAGSQTSTTATGLTAGTYIVTVTDFNGCTAVSTATVGTTNGSGTASTTVVSNVLCFGGATGVATANMAGGTAGFTYIWTTAGTAQTASGLSAGTYAVTIKDANGCETSSSVTITQPPAGTASTTSTPATCGGSNGTATVTASGGTGTLTYIWAAPAPGNQTGTTATGLTAGSYVVSITDANGCVGSTTALVNNNGGGVASISTGPSIKCNGGNTGSVTATIAGGTPGFNYSWNNGPTTSTNNNLIAGTYIVTVTDANSCSSVSSVTITEPTAITSTTATTTAACGTLTGSASVSPTGGTGAYTYSWSPTAALTQTVSGVGPGNYDVTITDANGCTKTNAASVSNAPAPTITSLTATTLLCNGDKNGTATVVASGGNGTLTYAWGNSGPSGTGATSFTGLGAGNYDVSVTDASGCTANSNVTITEPGAISAPTTTTTTTCGSSNGSVTVNPSGGAGTYTYAWSGGASSQTTPTATGLAAGPYTVTVKDVNGCTTTASAIVNNLNGGVASATLQSDVKCNGGSDGSAIASISGGGTFPFSYLWSNSAGTSPQATGLTAGTYSVTVTDLNGCSSVSTVLITAPPAIISSTSSVPATCGASNGTATVTASGGSGLLTYLWSNNQTTTTATGLNVGSYNVTITDASGCTKVDLAAVSNNSGPSITALTATTLLCNGSKNGTATVTASGGASPLTYSWSNNGPSGSAATSFTGIGAGTYVVNVTDASGCAILSSVTITDPAPIVLGSTSVDATCNTANGTATVSVVSGATGATTIAWDVTTTGGATGQTTATATGLAAGTYTVTITDGKGCTASTTASVKNTGAGIASTTKTNLTCNGVNDGTATASITGGVVPMNYLWNNSSSSVTASISNLPAGIYTVTVTDANGCASTASATISEPTAITNTTAKTDASCGNNNGTASVSNTTGGTGGYSYNWSSPGGTGITITGLGAGAYTVTVTDAANCTKVDVIAVSAVPGPVINGVSVNALACNGNNSGSATVSATGTNLKYLWSSGPGDTTTSIINRPAGTYQISVTDASGCTSVSTATITEPTVIVPSTTTTQAACGLSNGTATATATGGSSPLTFIWSNGTTSFTGSIYSGLPAGSYTVVVKDDNGCTKSDIAIVNNIGGPTLTSIMGVDVLCNGGNTGSATVTVANGTGPYTYSWSPGTSSITTSATNTIISQLADSFKVTIKDANGCQIISSITITQPTAVSVPTFSNSNAACAKSNGSATASSSGGTGILVYTWSTVPAQSGITATGLAAGVYIVTVTDGNGCSKTASTSIGTSNGPLATTSGTAPLCNVGNTGIATATVTSGTAPFTYSWSTGATTTQIINLYADTVYKVTVTDTKGCSSVSTVKLSKPAAIAITSLGKDVLCGSSNGSVKATITGGSAMYTYSWSNGASSITASLIDSIASLSAGSYTLTVTDSKGCTSTKIDTVGTISTGVINAVPAQQTINEGNSVSITVSGGVTYTWSPGAGLNCTTCPNPVATPTVSTIYTVTATDANGCTVTAMINITVKQACFGDESDVFIANIFSPNNDGRNDILFIEGNGLINIYWAIYDRWGNLLFESFSQSSGWDGTRKGSPMESGTYVYYLKATCIKTNTEVKLKGNVSIVK